MKIYISDKTISKLNDMIQTKKPGFISMRKYKKDKDPQSNIFKGIKLTAEQRKRHYYSIYINKERLEDLKKMIEDKPDTYKEGGIIPFLLPLLAGLGAAGSLAGGSAAIAKTIIDKKNNDAKLEEEKRNNLEMEKIARGEALPLCVAGDGAFLSPSWKSYGMSLDVKDFINGSKLDDVGKKTLRNIIKNLSHHFKIERQGEGLYLSYPR